MANFISARKKELELCKKLLLIRAETKKFKGEDFIVKEELIARVEIAISECEQMWNKYTDNKKVVAYRERFKEKAKILIRLMGDLMKETNFYGAESIYRDVLQDLCRATTLFINIAE